MNPQGEVTKSSVPKGNLHTQPTIHHILLQAAAEKSTPRGLLLKARRRKPRSWRWTAKKPKPPLLTFLLQLRKVSLTMEKLLASRVATMGCRISRTRIRRGPSGHSKRCHKKHTPRSLSFLWRKGRPRRKRGVSKQQTHKHQQVREAKYATHDVFTYRPGHWSKSERGCAVFCRSCLAHLQHESKTVRHLTCGQRLKRLRTNPLVRMHKRSWWICLRDENPQEMTQFLAASGLTQDAVEDLAGLKLTPTPRQVAWAKAKAVRAKAQASKRPKRRAKVKAAAAAVGTRPPTKAAKASTAKVRPKARSSGRERAGPH